MEILAQRGYGGLTLDEVARVAGVGKSSLYARFPSRPALAAAAVASLQRELPAPSGELRQDLIAILRAAERGLAQAGPGVLGAVLAAGSAASSPGSTDQPGREPILGPLARRVHRLLEQRTPVPVADPDAGSELLVAGLLGRLVLGQTVSEPWPERMVDLVLGSPEP